MTGVVIFSFSHIMQFTQITTLKFKKHKNDHTVLMYDTATVDSVFAERISRSQIFDVMIPYRDSIFYMIDSKEELVQQLSSYFGNLLTNNSIDLRTIDCVYSAGEIANSFGLFAAISNLKFYLYETRPGLLKDKSRYTWGQKDGWLSKSYSDLQKEYGTLCGELDNLFTITYPKNKLHSTKSKSFDFHKSFSNLEHDDAQRILSCFDIEKKDLSGEIQLLLPNSISHTVNTTVFKEKQVPYVYQVMLDYYGTGQKLVVKQHPHDKVDFTPYLKGATKLSSNYPIELIRLWDDVSIYSIVSGYTTSAWRIKDMSKKWKQTGLKFFRYCHLIHEFRICIDICIQNNITELSTNIPLEFISEFIKNFSKKITVYDEGNTTDAATYLFLKSKPMTIPENARSIIIDDLETKIKDETGKIIVTVKKCANNSIAPETTRYIQINNIPLKSYDALVDLYYEDAQIIAKYVPPIDLSQIIQLLDSAIDSDMDSIKALINLIDSKKVITPPDEVNWWVRIVGTDPKL